MKAASGGAAAPFARRAHARIGQGGGALPRERRAFTVRRPPSAGAPPGGRGRRVIPRR
ncbi:hypothetical protein BSIN_1221 [Burkholderia singularis]|uniref:Uncharacterized protein n=1 Tax=Burkholderia singularis TaxID=1503053 RepID=A0A238HCD8_9BURK|nr:hypothetical protein BSIN_1221 [Burkholderia singularis]